MLTANLPPIHKDPRAFCC